MGRRKYRISLYRAIKASYDPNDGLNEFGYHLDHILSDNNNKVYYNQFQRKLLFSVKGTDPFNPNDLYTDAKLAFGLVKSTHRYKSAHEILRAAKAKYGITATVIGHSLGGNLSQNITSKEDRSYTYNSGYTYGQRTKGNDYRTWGDIVSLLGSSNKTVQTLENHNQSTGWWLYDALAAHGVENIREERIYVN